jgi:tryptophan-rich sensory protein
MDDARETPREAGWRKWIVLAALLALVAGVSLTGAAFTTPRIAGWYASLNKPFFNPPPWVFGPVWTALYAMMAFAAWRVWLAPESVARRTALTWFFVQLFINAIWSPVFFGMEAPGIAMFVIVALLAALVLTVQRFFAVDRVAGWLLIPYLVWVVFASHLNGAIVALN